MQIVQLHLAICFFILKAEIEELRLRPAGVGGVPGAEPQAVGTLAPEPIQLALAGEEFTAIWTGVQFFQDAQRFTPLCRRRLQLPPVQSAARLGGILPDAQQAAASGRVARAVKNTACGLTV